MSTESQQTFGLRFHAEGEVRRPDGTLRHTVTTDDSAPAGLMNVTVQQLRDAVARHGTTDDRLRELGFSEDTIRQIRSTT